MLRGTRARSTVACAKAGTTTSRSESIATTHHTSSCKEHKFEYFHLIWMDMGSISTKRELEYEVAGVQARFALHTVALTCGSDEDKV